MTDLYGDEEIFDGLLRQAMMKQLCERCGYEMGHERAGGDEAGVINFAPLRFKKECEDCRRELQAVREARREEREHKAKEKARAAKRLAKSKLVTAPSVYRPPDPPEAPKRVALDPRYWDLIIEAISNKYPKVSLEEIEAKVLAAREKHENETREST